MLEMMMNSKMVKKLVEKFVARAISKKLGCDINFNLDELTVNVNDETAKINISAKAELKTNDLTKVMESIMNKD